VNFSSDIKDAAYGERVADVRCRGDDCGTAPASPHKGVLLVTTGDAAPIRTQVCPLICVIRSSVLQNTIKDSGPYERTDWL
jgi:hypothetical protein